MSNTVRIATRQSPLALWQAYEVKALLEKGNPALKVELLPMTTKGDRNQSTSLAKIGGKGLFIKELENALLDKSADLAVHSMKDVTAQMPPGLVISTLLEREDPQDALVSSRYKHIDELPSNAIIGTCSPRRQAQLLAKYPNFQIRELRGNVGTRLAKLDAGEFDATLLACAGLKRLEMENRIAQALPTTLCLPAIAQGTIGIEIRNEDSQMRELLEPLNHHETVIRTTAERAMSAMLNGGCSAPIAGFATIHHNSLQLIGRVIELDGSTLLEVTQSAPLEDAQSLGESVAQELLNQGAKRILEAAEMSKDL